MRPLTLAAALLVPAAAFSLSPTTGGSIPANHECNAAVSIVSGCATNSGTQLTITDSRTTRNGDSSPSSPEPRPNIPGRADLSTACTPDPARITTCGLDAVKVTNEAQRPLTITDVAAFAPPPVTITAEPSDAGVAGMASNFVAPASAQTQSGELFGRAITVRFTPIGFDFVHGDGTTATTSTAGQTWAALGQAPFTPTATSHTYRERGTYLARVTVRYTAEVDLGGGWFPVPGELAVPGAVQAIRIFEARTALVAHTCDQRPSAPGC